MSQNPVGESSTPIHSGIDEIYRNQTGFNGAPVFDKQKSEFVIHPASEKLYVISRNIAEARSQHLDANFFDHEIDENKFKFVRAVAKGVFHRDLPIHHLEPLTEDILKRRESAIGATIFGPIPSNVKRLFFYDKGDNSGKEEWFFHEEVTNAIGAASAITFHYEVQPEGVLRISNEKRMNCYYINDQELDNFMSATQIYHDLVLSQIYCQDISADKKAA